MTQFFTKFPLIPYDMSVVTEYVLVRDIIHRVQFKQIVKNNVFVFYPYSVKEEETPEIIAAKLYGSAQYHWLVLFANDIYNLWTDWPLTYFQFIDFLIKKYGSVETAQSQVHHYEDINGYWIDFDTYNASIADGAISVNTYDYEVSLNEDKKQINLVDKIFVNQIEDELDKLLVTS